MHLKTRNVNTAFHTLIDMFINMREATDRYRPNSREWDRLGLPRYRVTESRNGPVAVIDEPLTVSYERPTERVLFNPVRDANPFFHLYESLWMLAGRNDVDSVSYYAKQMREYSDDGKTLNGAYGRRWRATQGVPQLTPTGYYRPGIDQLTLLASHLKAQPNSRRAVLRMWNVEEDLLKIDGVNHSPAKTVTPPSKDVCCNLDAMFSIRSEPYAMRQEREPAVVRGEIKYLDMTVTNRSNDMLWGMLGANYVHFTFLLEYMAARVGVLPGHYHHFTNNCHVYTSRPDWRPGELLNANDAAWYDDTGVTVTQGLVSDPETFDEEVYHIVERYSGVEPMEEPFRPYTEPFLINVAQPMFDAWLARKKKVNTVEEHLAKVKDDAWRIAAQEWVRRRVKK